MYKHGGGFRAYLLLALEMLQCGYCVVQNDQDGVIISFQKQV